MPTLKAASLRQPNGEPLDRDTPGASRYLIATSHQQIFDLYIPDAIYHKPATRDFIEELRRLAEGATVYQAVEGSWHEEIESVRVMRLAITVIDGKGQRLWETEDVRRAVVRVVEDFMDRLHQSGAPPEEAMFFNDWSARGTLITRGS